MTEKAFSSMEVFSDTEYNSEVRKITFGKYFG